jgi:hypothetical protein
MPTKADLICAGNFIGPLVFLQDEKPLYTTGWIVTVSIVAASYHSRILNASAGRNVRNLHRPCNHLPFRVRTGEQEARQ